MLLFRLRLVPDPFVQVLEAQLGGCGWIVNKGKSWAGLPGGWQHGTYNP